MAGLNLCTLFLLASLVCGGLAVAKASFTYKSAIGGSEELVRTRRATRVDPCPNGQIMCEDGGEDYPIDVVKQLAAAGGGEFKHLFGVDPDPEVVPRISQGGEGMCASKRQIIFPKKARDPESGEFVHVINDDDLKQGVAVELCMDTHRQCKFSDYFPKGYTSTCVQKTMYKSLVYVDRESHRPKKTLFEAPSCCACSISRA